MVRHIEYQSNATETYESAFWHQVTSGIGYWRVITEYVDDDGHDQEIYIKRVADRSASTSTRILRSSTGRTPCSGSPSGTCRASSSRRNIRMSRSAKTYAQPLDNTDDWDDKDHVRVAEYFRKSEKSTGW